MTVPHVVVAGAGFAGLEAAFNLKMRIKDAVRVTVVNDTEHFLFKPNTIYIPFGKDPESLRVPLAPACEKADVDLRIARVTGVDVAGRALQTDGGDISYDHLVLATGATMRPEELPGLADHANTIWTVDEMLRLRDSLGALVAKVRDGHAQAVAFLVPPNNKCSGPLYEMVMMLDTWLRREEVRDDVDIHFATYESGFIQAFGPRLDEVVVQEFQQRNIHGHRGYVAQRVEDGRVFFEGGHEIAFDLLIAFPAYAAGTRFTGLPTDERGFIRTELATRRVIGHDDIWAAGDTGDFPVKQAFLAFLQGDAIAEDIAQRVTGEAMEHPFDPVSMCIMEQFDKATFAQVPLRLTGDPTLPVAVDEGRLDEYRVGTGHTWQLGKKMLGMTIPYRFRHGKPFHAGATWASMEAGLNMMKAALSD